VIPPATAGPPEEAIRQAESSTESTHATVFLTQAVNDAGVYHHAVRRALGTSPLAAWQAGLARRATAPVSLMTTRPSSSTFCPASGGWCAGVAFNSSGALLGQRLESLGRAVTRTDAGRVQPEKPVAHLSAGHARHLLAVPYRRLGQPAISLWEQRAAMTRLQAAGHRAIDDILIFKSVQEQRTLVETARTSRHDNGRSRAGPETRPPSPRHRARIRSERRTIPTCRRARRGMGMSEDLGRAHAGLSADERIDWIREDRWIHYARADQVLARLTDLLTYPPRDGMPCLLLFGATGTRIVHKFLHEHRSSFDERSGRTPLPAAAAVQLPPTPSERDFYEELLISMGAVLPLQQSVSTLRHRTRILARQLDVRMLIIDEIHAILGGTYRAARAA
jgi:hypothetical protein